MATGHAVILGGYALSAILSVALGVFVWRNREKSGAFPLAVCLFATGLYSGSLFVAGTVDSFAISRFVIRVLFIGIVTSIATIFLFVLEYTGRERLITRTTVAALSIEPIVVVGLVFANPGNVFFESIEPDPTSLTGIAIEWGIAAALHTIYSYLLMMTASLLVLEFLYRSRSLYRGQAAALLGATIIPTIANMALISGLIEFDPMPIGYLVTGSLFTVAIFRYQLVDIVPIARDRVLDNVSDGVFVVDKQDRLIDVNPVGRDMLGAITDAPIGMSAESLFADFPDTLEAYDELTARPVETERELAAIGSHYHVRTTPIEDGRERHVGWLFLVRDITDRKRRETQLQRQNERLDRFANVVSHDLRNPLAVADGYVDLTRETGELSNLDKVEKSHDRMSAIIDDVLTLAREGEAVTEPEAVALADIAERAWESAETDDATLSIDGATAVLADPDRLQRLLENLFRNAVEHGSTSPRSETHEDAVEHGSTSPNSQAQRDTRDDELSTDSPAESDDAATKDGAADASLTVSVGVIGTNAAYGFYVADDGRGLPDESERVFEEGYTTDAEGTGFGLSIVEGIATAHGWTVEASESETGGARFEFTDIETDETNGATRTRD